MKQRAELLATLDNVLALLEDTEWFSGEGHFMIRCNVCGQARADGPKHKRGCRWVRVVNKARRVIDD